MRTIVVGLFLALAPSTVTSQQSLVGTWKVTYPAGARVENGVQTPIMGTGTLQVTAERDSLIGNFIADPDPELPKRGPTRLAGLASPGRSELSVRQMLVVEVNGEQKPVMLTSTWDLEAKGDSLSGTLSHKVEGADLPAQDPGPVRGIRR